MEVKGKEFWVRGVVEREAWRCRERAAEEGGFGSASGKGVAVQREESRGKRGVFRYGEGVQRHKKRE